MQMITGTGDLVVNGELLGKVEYKITVTQTGAIRRASGVIWGRAEHIHQAFEAADAKIVRDDCGHEMTIVITSHQMDGQGQIAVSGSPGPLA